MEDLDAAMADVGDLSGLPELAAEQVTVELIGPDESSVVETEVPLG